LTHGSRNESRTPPESCFISHLGVINGGGSAWCRGDGRPHQLHNIEVKHRIALISQPAHYPKSRLG